MRSSARRQVFGGTALALGLLLLLTGGAEPARADCALIPAALRKLPSTNGGVGAPIAVPGATVLVFADNVCNGDPEQPFFDPTAANNEVTLTFEPAGGAATTFPAFAASDVKDCDVPADPSDPARCYLLEVQIPSAAQLEFGPMAGSGKPLAGTARIEVRNTVAEGSPVVAEIGPLFEPTVSCNPANRFPALFSHFTVLPAANVFDEATTQLEAALDGTGAIVIPFDYSGVLAGDVGSANLRLLQVEQALEDGISSGETAVLAQNTDGFAGVRAFSSDGRPIPPLIEVNLAGDRITGSVDFVDSVIRIAATDADGNAVFDYSGALLNGAGPVVLGSGPDSTVAGTLALRALGAAPLNSLSQPATGTLAAVARDEMLEAPFAPPGAETPGDLNEDDDNDDQVGEVVANALGATFSTETALTERTASPTKPVIVAESGLVAGTQSEARDADEDQTGDGDEIDDVLRVWTLGEEEGAATLDEKTGTEAVPVDIAGSLVGPGQIDRPVVISEDAVFFLVDELASDPATTEEKTGVEDSVSDPADPSISSDGSATAFVATVTDYEDDYGEHVIVRSRFSGASGGFIASALPADASCEDLDLDGFRSPTINEDGSYVAFASAGSGGQIYRAQLSDSGSFVCEGSKAPLARTQITAGDGASDDPSISGDGSQIAFESDSTDLLAGGPATSGQQVFVWNDGTIALLSRSAAGTPGSGTASNPAISKDGRFVAFVYDGADLLAPGIDQNGERDIYVVDRDADGNGVYDEPGAGFSIERVSVASDGSEGDDDSTDPALSADGRYVAFESEAGNLADDDDSFSSDVFVRDRREQETRRASVRTNGEPFSGESTDPDISDCGRYVVFRRSFEFIEETFFDLLYRHDLLTGVTDAVSSSTSAFFPAVSADGFSVAFLDETEDPVILLHRPSFSASLLNDDDSDLDDTVLHAFLPNPLGGDFVNSERSVIRKPDDGVPQVAVAGGLALAIGGDPSRTSFLFDPEAGDVADLKTDTTAVALSEDAVCLISEATGTPRLYAGDPGTVLDLGVGALAEVTEFEAAEAQAVANQCVAVSQNPSLRILTLTPNPTGPPTVDIVDTCQPAEDFQVDESGVAFRTCESDLVPPADLNGDGDTEDCVMRFWDFSVTVDETCDTDPLIETGYAARICEIDGCMPFFEPYRILNGLLSFASQEDDGVEAGGADVSPVCLPTVGPGLCDLNADRDGDDLVIVVVPLSTCGEQGCKSYVYTPDPEGGEVPPFPNADGTLVILVDGVVVIVGDSDGDGNPDFDQKPDPAFASADNCPEVSNPDQTDADNDILGAVCDGAASDTNVADTPGQTVCDLDSNGLIIQPEVDQVEADANADPPVPVGPPTPAGQPGDDRDPDANGRIDATDVAICQALCDGQPNGCQATNAPPCPCFSVDDLTGPAWFRSCRALRPWAASFTEYQGWPNFNARTWQNYCSFTSPFAPNVQGLLTPAEFLSCRQTILDAAAATSVQCLIY